MKICTGSEKWGKGTEVNGADRSAISPGHGDLMVPLSPVHGPMGGGRGMGTDTRQGHSPAPQEGCAQGGCQWKCGGGG